MSNNKVEAEIKYQKSEIYNNTCVDNTYNIERNKERKRDHL